MSDGNDNSRTRWCGFHGIRGMDRILRNGQELDSEGTPYSLPVAQGHREGNNSEWSWHPDPCNIVVYGTPGTGKSTLAMDMAAEIRTVLTKPKGKNGHEVLPDSRESCTVLYYALEQLPESLESRFKQLAEAPITGESSAETSDTGESTALAVTKVPNRDESVAECVKQYLAERKEVTPDEVYFPNLVLFPQLSPRPLEDVDEAGNSSPDRTSIFWRRYGEIRHLVEGLQKREQGEAAKEQEAEKRADRLPPLRMVVIDSLSMFGDKPVTRYLVDQLFTLFREKSLIGLLVMEERGGDRPGITSEHGVPSDVCFAADVVIRLGWMEGDGYSHRTMEVTKSRHSPNSYGKQWIKVRDKGIEVYPSLHNWYTHLHSGGVEDPKKQRGVLPLLAGDLAEHLNPESLPESSPAPPCSIVLVAGPQGTGKASLAAQYALSIPENEAFLLVSFAGCANPEHQATRCGSFRLDTERVRHPYIDLASSKGSFDYISVHVPGKTGIRYGYQLWLAPGYLLSEELVWFTDECLEKTKVMPKAGGDALRGPISRVIFTDVGHIPSRYPAVCRQILDGTSNFFPVLRKLFEHHQVDCIFVCSTDDRRHDLTQFLKPLAHHCIETRRMPGTVVWGSRGRIQVTVSGRWVRGWKQRTFGPDWSS